MAIDHDGLKKYLETLKYKDFQKAYVEKSKIEKAHAMDDIERFNIDRSTILLSSVIFFNEPFLVDAVGNDLSVVYLTRRKYKLPNGRVARCKFDKTIISDCKKTYGSCLNGYWKIPKEFITEDI